MKEVKRKICDWFNSTLLHGANLSTILQQAFSGSI